MFKNGILFAATMTALGIAGILVHTWWGGFMAGICFWSYFLQGVRLMRKAKKDGEVNMHVETK